MSVGFTPGGPVTPGGVPFGIGEPFSGDPRVAPGLPRPIGWEVRTPDGSAAYLKTGLADTAWLSFADLGGGGGGGVTSVNGATGAVVVTVEGAYAAGTSTLNDQVMHFPSGDLRFVGASQGPFDWPNLYFLEKDTAAQGDPRIGVWGAARFVSPSGGGNRWDEHIGYNPTWNGSFGGIGGWEAETETVAFTQNPFIDPLNASVGAILGQRRWQQQFGFFDGPQAYPTPGFNSGARENHFIDLWNGFSGGLFGHPALDVNGFGQATCNTISTATGVITCGLNLSWWWGPSPVAGDGVGLFFTLGTDDPPKGLIANRLLTTDIHGRYQLAFYTADNTNSLDGPIMTLDWVNGAVFNVPVTQQGQPPVLAYFSADIDLTTVSSGNPIVPAPAPGKNFFPLRFQVYQVVTTGAMNAGPGGVAIIRCTNGATEIIAATSAFTDQTAFGFGVGGLSQGQPAQGTLNVGTGTTLDVLQAATGTGGFAYTVRVVLTGFYA